MRRYVIVGLWFLSVAMLVTRLTLVAFVVFLLIIALTSAGKTVNPLKAFVWAYVWCFCGVIILYQVAWLANLKVDPLAVLILLAVVSGGMLVLRRNTARPKLNFKPSGWLGLAAGLAVCCFICLPLVMHPSYGEVVRLAAKTGDDINHISFIEADRKADSYIYSAGNNSTELLAPARVGYPQGWHMNGAVTETFFLRLVGKDNTAHRLLSYLLYKTWWLFIATFFLYEAGLAITRVFMKRESKAAPWLLAIGAAVLSVYFLVSLSGFGFADFIAEIGLILAAICLACKNLRSEDERSRKLSLLALAVVTVAVTCVWVLPGAVVGLLTLILVWREWSRDHHFFKWLDWLALAVTGLLTLSQAYITEAKMGLGHINLAGAYPTFSVKGAVAMIIITIAATLIFARPGRGSWLASLVVIFSLEFVALALYQKITLGNPQYYAIKLGFLAAIVASVTLLALASAYFGVDRRAGIASAGLAVVVLVVVPLLLGLSLKNSAFPIKNGVVITASTARKILQAPSNPNYVIKGQTPEDTFLANMLHSEIVPYYSPARQAVIAGLHKRL